MNASHTAAPEREPSLAGLTGDSVDPELLALPDPPRQERRATMVLLALAAMASLAMVGALSREAAYAFSPQRAVSIGDLREAPISAFSANAFVEGGAMLAGASAIRYEHAFESDTYRLAPVAGRDTVWVEVRVPAGEEGSRYVPATRFEGRLIPFDKSGLRHRGLAGSVHDLTGRAVPEGAWLLVDGQTPRAARSVGALAILFLVFAAWNLGTLFRLARKLK